MAVMSLGHLLYLAFVLHCEGASCAGSVFIANKCVHTQN